MFSSVNIAADDLKRRINELPTNEAPGADEIALKLLIERVDYLCEPLEYIYRENHWIKV
jgi:hypothetical protein